LSEGDLYTLRTMRHIWWLYARLFPSRTPLPVRRLEEMPSPPSTDADVALCRRIVAAFRASEAATGVQTALSPMWRKHVETDCAPLLALLRSGDAEALADAMGAMCSTEFLYGADAHALYTGKHWRVYSLKLLDNLVSLAEQLAVVPAESGQAVVGQAFAGGLDKLVCDTERALGVSLDFPQVATAYGITVGETFLNLQCCEYAYVAWRLARVAESWNLPPRISLLEIGAGYGGAAMYLARMLGDRLGQYFIADLPVANVLQAYFLGKVFGGDRVRLWGEPDRPSLEPLFVILPGSEIPSLGPLDILLNENSFPEIPPQAVTAYLEWARHNVRHFLFSYNHETLAPDLRSAVTTVPGMIARVGGFRRVSRNLSWPRVGYVEEVWTVA
jgi:hypothetical protein